MHYLAVIAALAASSALAQEVDIGAKIEANRLVTWAMDHDLAMYLNPQRVFEGEMALISGSVVGEEPGYFFLPNSPFAGQTFGFDIRRAVRAWDPLGPSNAPNANFQAVSASTITFGDIVLGTVTSPLIDPPTPITGLQVTIPAAGVDFHYPMTLNTPALSGIYLVELELRTGLSGVADSLPYWMVLNYGLDPLEHDRAMDYVNEFVVPAPGSTALAAIALFVAPRRRRAR